MSNVGGSFPLYECTKADIKRAINKANGTDSFEMQKFLRNPKNAKMRKKLVPLEVRFWPYRYILF